MKTDAVSMTFQEAASFLKAAYTMRTSTRGGGVLPTAPFVCLYGPRGIGKTACPYQAARELGVPIVVLSGVDGEVTDYKGIPDLDTDPLRWKRPAPLEMKEGIIVIDEFLSARPPTQRAINRVLNGVDPNGEAYSPDVMIVATGNEPGGPEGAYMPPVHVRNRGFFIRLRVDEGEWEQWAVEEGVHPHVLAFHRWTGFQWLMVDEEREGLSVTTPRSWHSVSTTLWHAEKSGAENLVALNVIGATIHPEEAVKFLEFVRVADELPDWRDIIAGKAVKPVDMTRKDVMFILATTLGQRVPLPIVTKVDGKNEETTIPDGLMAAVEYMDGFPGDIITMFVQDVSARCSADQSLGLLSGTRGTKFHETIMRIHGRLG